MAIPLSPLGSNLGAPLTAIGRFLLSAGRSRQSTSVVKVEAAPGIDTLSQRRRSVVAVEARVGRRARRISQTIKCVRRRRNQPIEILRNGLATSIDP